MTPSSFTVGLDPTPIQVTVTTTARSSSWPLLPPSAVLWALGLLLVITARTRARQVRRFAGTALLLAMIGVV